MGFRPVFISMAMVGGLWGFAWAACRPPTPVSSTPVSTDTRLAGVRLAFFKNGELLAQASAQELVQNAQGDSELKGVRADARTGSRMEGKWKSKNGPVEIAADALKTDQMLKEFRFAGHVRVRQGQRVMHCSALAVRAEHEEVTGMKCSGPVRLTEGKRVATAGLAVFDSGSDWIELTSRPGEPAPQLVDGDNRLTGSRIRVHARDGQIEVVSPKGVLVPQK